MYEPYGEGRKFKIDVEKLREWKGKLKEKIKNLKSNKWVMIVIAIVVLVVLGSYSGWVAYTGKISEIQSQIMILERQIKACQTNVSSCFSNLENTENQLSTCQTDKQDCENKLENTKGDLNECNTEKGLLRTSLLESESIIEEWKTKYGELESDFKDLETEHEDMGCYYASDVCGRIGMNYYFVKDNVEVVCCLKNEPDYCIQKPGSEDVIKEIKC